MTKLKSDLPPHVVKALLEYSETIERCQYDLTCNAAENGKPDAGLYQAALNDAVLKFRELLINIRVRPYPADGMASACSATGDLLQKPFLEDDSAPF